MDTPQAIRTFLSRSGWLPAVEDVRFLAAGEYNQNHLVTTTDGQQYVLRVNTGSQLGLGPDQIVYEFGVLQAVGPSDVTPKPLFVQPGPNGLSGGCLLMEYLEGRPLDYATDLKAAAGIFAAVHALPPSAKLIRQDNAIADIAAESWGLMHRHPDHPRRELLPLLREQHANTLKLAEDNQALFAHDAPVMVNTEVNSGNFIVGPRQAWLVDWEKAVVSSRHQDLGHFLVATTTRWKAKVVLVRQQKDAFLAAYHAALRERTPSTPGAPGAALSLDELTAGAAVLERTILLRALSWCYMAYYEYTVSGRAIHNPDTLATITRYLDEAECIFESAE